jgi:hypothetical protein
VFADLKTEELSGSGGGRIDSLVVEFVAGLQLSGARARPPTIGGGGAPSMPSRWCGTRPSSSSLHTLRAKPADFTAMRCSLTSMAGEQAGLHRLQPVARRGNLSVRRWLARVATWRASRML